MSPVAYVQSAQMTEIIATGGTFDKILHQPPNQDDYEFPEVSHIVEALARRRIDLRPHLVTTLMMIDSLDMETRHFQQIVSACLQSRQERVVVVHGTDQMIKSARMVKEGYVQARLNGTGKSIVFTGAMVPYSENQAHASYNLLHALEVADVRPGVHIAMNGEVFDPDNVRKNYDTLMFERAQSITG
jgi:L-asparaginase